MPAILTTTPNSTTLVLDILEHVQAVAPTIPSGGWASIIGIVTAIIGNVLISFALNTQRYAHVRLQRDGKEKKKEPHDTHKRRRTYGTVQKEIADERSKVNLTAKDENIPDEVEELEPENEADLLIPHVQDPSLESSTASIAQAHDEKASESSSQKSYLRSPYWWLGMILMVVGECGNFLAYGFAPASIVSPLGVVALISNCIIAPIMLKERFRWRDALGVVIAVGGAVTVVLSAEGSNPKLGPGQIHALLKRWEFLTYFGITIGAIIVLSFLSNKYGHKTILIDIGLVGLYGGYTALSTKGVASLLSYRFFLVVTYPIAYLFVAVLVFTAVMQIKYINRALQHFSSTQVIPTQFVMFTIFVVLGSAILYRDFERTTPKKIAQFLGGVALTFLGVFCITGGRGEESDDGPEADDAAAAEEGRILLIDNEEEPTAQQEDLPDTDTRPLLRRTSTAPPAAPEPAQSLFRPPNLPTTSTADLESYIASAEAAASAHSPSHLKTTIQPPFNRATSTPLLRDSPYTLLQPPTLTTNTTTNFFSKATAPDSPSPTPRRPTHPSRRPVSDFSPTPSSPHNKNKNTISPTQSQLNLDISANTGTLAGSRNQISSRHASLVERMLSLPRPGPLVGPLSGGLSVVVAESLRRGIGGEAVDTPVMTVSPVKSLGRRSTGGNGIGNGRRTSGTGIERRESERAAGLAAAPTKTPVKSGAGVGFFRSSGLVRSQSQAVDEEEQEEVEEEEEEDAGQVSIPATLTTDEARHVDGKGKQNI